MGVAAAGYALAKLPPAAERQFLAALHARQEGDLPGALLRLDAAETKGYDAREIAGLRGELHFQLAKQAFLAGDLIAARDHCREALDAGKTNWQTYFLRARHNSASLNSTWRWPTSNWSITNTHVVKSTSCAAIVFVDWHSGLRRSGRIISPRNRGFQSAGLSNNMALALTKSGRREEAIEWLERALAADRSLGAAYYQRVLF